jgi:tetratricopeptide (TPR) repeat protein
MFLSEELFRMFPKRRMLLPGVCACLFVQACAANGQQSKASDNIAAPADSIASIQSLLRAHRYDEALQASQSALKAKPSGFRIWALEGIVFSIKGQDGDALKAFDKALKLSPDFSVALKGEVQLYYKTHDKRAIPLLKRILKSDASDQTAHEMLGVLDGMQEDCAEADEQLASIPEAIANHPDSLEIYGNCLVQTAQLDKAVPVFEQLVTLLPQRSYPKYDLAVVLVATKQNEAAIKLLDPLLESNSSDPDILSLASDAYEAVGNTPKAVALLRQAIVLSPTTVNYYNSFAAICLDHESFQVGIDMINAGLKRITNEPSLYISRGLLYAQIAQYDQAEADFKTAEHLDSVQSISSYAIDLAELQQNNTGSALSQVRAQLKIHPDSALLHYLLAKMLSTEEGSDADANASSEALQEALLSAKLKPDMTEARDLLATMYAGREQYDLAIQQCQLALQSNPGDQTAIYHLIVAYRHSGQADQRAQIPVLVKRLAELQKTARQKETERKGFKLVEQQPAAQP